MGREVVIEASSAEELSRKLDELKSSLDGIKASVDLLYRAVPFTAPYSKGYKYLFGESDFVQLNAGDTADVITLQDRKGFIMQVLGILVGHPYVNIKMVFETAGSITSYSYNAALGSLHGLQRSTSMFKVTKFDPVANIYVMETFPPDFVTFFDGYFNLSLQNYAKIPVLYAYRYIIALDPGGHS